MLTDYVKLNEKQSSKMPADHCINVTSLNSNVIKQEEAGRIAEDMSHKQRMRHSSSTIFASSLGFLDKKQNEAGSEINHENTRDLCVLNVHPETFRIISYLNFWFMIFVAIISTNLFVDESKVHDSPLVDTFGYNNICVYFDYFPSLYVTAVIYPFVEIPYIFYMFLNLLRIRKAGKIGVITNKHVMIVSSLTFFEFAFFAWFRMVFVVHVDNSVYFHTIGFVCLQIALVLNELIAFSYYSKVVEFTKMQYYVGLSYVCIFMLITSAKIVIAQASMLTQLIDVSNPAVKEFVKSLDSFWMLLAAVLPLLIAYRMRKESPTLCFTF